MNFSEKVTVSEFVRLQGNLETYRQNRRGAGASVGLSIVGLVSSVVLAIGPNLAGFANRLAEVAGLVLVGAFLPICLTTVREFQAARRTYENARWNLADSRAKVAELSQL